MAEEEKPNEAPILTEYTEDHIRHLSDMEHIRTRPGMYIGKLATALMPKTVSTCF